jgi:dolichol-phosphate hexosyltransferase
MLSKETFESNQSITIIVPTLNEGASIKKVLDDIPQQVCACKVQTLVIDGGSNDDTVKIAEKCGVKVVRQKTRGKGTAMREAVNLVNTDIIVFIDGDETYPLDKLESIVEPILKENADVVVGKRLKRKDGDSIPFINRFGNKMFNKMINFAMKSNVTDSLSGYRAMRTQVFKDLLLFSDGFEIEVEITVEALSKGYRITEVPIEYGERHDTESKLNSSADGIRIAKTLLFVMMNIRPLLFFGIFSLVFFVIGLYPTSIVIYEKIILGEIIHIASAMLASLLIITGILVLVLGIISEMLVRTRKRIEYLIKNKM